MREFEEAVLPSSMPLGDNGIFGESLDVVEASNEPQVGVQGDTEDPLTPSDLSPPPLHRPAVVGPKTPGLFQRGVGNLAFRTLQQIARENLAKKARGPAATQKDLSGSSSTTDSSPSDETTEIV